MKKKLQIIYVLLLCVVLAGCSSSTEPTTAVGFTGSIYYSDDFKMAIYRMQLSDQSTDELFLNARHPDITAKGEILCIEVTNPTARIMYSDATGATRKSLIESDVYPGPVHKYYFNKPRMSYNQKYVAYEGGSLTTIHTYVVDASTGALVATIGDYNARQPMISPSWAPDGSIIVQGWPTINNGIYKVAADFSATVRIDPNLTNVSEPSVSPDGTTIAFIRDGKVNIMSIDGSNPEQLYTSSLQFRMPTWSPDSKYIAAVNSGDIYIFDVKGKTATKITKVPSVSAESQLCWRY